MKNTKVMLRFDDFSSREKYVLRRIEGTATPGSMIRLIDVADLKANPREAKVGDVTEEIEESLKSDPQLFPFKSKGVLLAADKCIPRERNRFELTFEDEDIEGVLDGGHNLLAIARHILRRALGDSAEKILRNVKRWEHVSPLWHETRDKIDEIKSTLEFLTPVEVVFAHDGSKGMDAFQDAILDVARARNNNAELKEETKANKAGFYDEFRKCLEPKLASQIEWKTNDGGRIKMRDIVALSWIALSKISEELPGLDDFKKVAIYANKGLCVAWFNKLMESDEVSKEYKGKIRELVHPAVKSALALTKDLPRLYDQIYQEFPDAYNNASPGFGRIGSVYMWDPKKHDSGESRRLSSPPHTKFYRSECVYDYPDGFIMPLVGALSELMEYKDGQVNWRGGVDPAKFLRKNLKETLKVYWEMIKFADYDPQKVGKAAACYNLLENDFRSRLK